MALANPGRANGPACAWESSSEGKGCRRCEYGWSGPDCTVDAIPACRARDSIVDSCVVRKVLLMHAATTWDTRGCSRMQLMRSRRRCSTVYACSSASVRERLRCISGSRSPSRCAPRPTPAESGPSSTGLSTQPAGSLLAPSPRRQSQRAAGPACSSAQQHGQSDPLGSDSAHTLCHLRPRLAALGSSVLSE